MNARRGFLLGVIAVGALSACGGTRGSSEKRTETTMTPQDMLAAAGLAEPGVELTAKELDPIGDQEWRAVVEFIGEPAVIEAWVEESFPSGIASRAYKDDMAQYAGFVGEGVQKKGDRIASGTHEGAQFVVVVGQQAQPVVHVGVAQT